MGAPTVTAEHMDLKAEWLEADGLGGFASGTVSGVRTRRYHALLLVATAPPAGRMVLVNGFDAWVETPAGTFALSSQRYMPDVVCPDGMSRIEDFEPEPWPRWTFRLEDGTVIEQELFVPHDLSAVVLSWRLRDPAAGVRLHVRPLFSGRDYHCLHHENPSFRFEPEGGCVGGESGVGETRLAWRPYTGVPGIAAVANGLYRHQPEWYRNFLYEEELSRGLEWIEDLASPGLFRWDLSAGEAGWILSTEQTQNESLRLPAARCLEQLRATERERRRKFPSRLHRSADAYLVRRGEGKTIVAGYPWFTDWGRDTFISLRGLCLATGRLDDARAILLQWAGAVSEGMLPNLFADQGDKPEFNSVDASLWYVVAVHDFFQAMDAAKRRLPDGERKRLQEAIEAILSGYARGTRFGIYLDDDGLLAAGRPGVQLTWMDAKAGDWVVTPRIGKPVEVQALWLNALKIAGAFSDRWHDWFEKGRAAFTDRFWNEAGGCLYDVVDVDHQPGTVDAAFRPNQIFAVGGLPLMLLDDEKACRVIEAVEARLWTPLGLRSLAPGEPGYRSRYQGGVLERDGAYHQGTVWPWLIGPFVEAWVRVLDGTPTAKQKARERFLAPL
nr:glycogen debranching enzyme N-terminal domain-containing protein [Nitrospirota bacterium]